MRHWRLFDRALQIDPNDADALAGEAYVHGLGYSFRMGRLLEPTTTPKSSA